VPSCKFTSNTILHICTTDSYDYDLTPTYDYDPLVARLPISSRCELDLEREGRKEVSLGIPAKRLRDATTEQKRLQSGKGRRLLSAENHSLTFRLRELPALVLVYISEGEALPSKEV